MLPAGSGDLGPRVTLSIVIPTWNTAELLNRMLSSIVGTNETSCIEIIVVDDGSTDHTADVVREFSQRCPVRYLQLAHAGVNPARNAGWKVASGVYVTFVDSDDIVRPQWLTRILGAIATDPPPDVISSGTEVQYVNGRTEVNLPRGGPMLSDFSPVFTAGSLVFRTALLHDINGYDEQDRAGTHAELWRRFVDKYRDEPLRCRALPEVLYEYQRRRGSFSSDLTAMLEGSRYLVEQMRQGTLVVGDVRKARIQGRHAVNLRRSGQHVPAVKYAFVSFRTHPTLRSAVRLLACVFGPMSNTLERRGIRRLPG